MPFLAGAPKARSAGRRWRRARLVLGAIIAAYVIIWLAGATLGSGRQDQTSEYAAVIPDENGRR